jgi:hypothetical protein
VARLDSVIASGASRANTPALETAHFLGDRFSCPAAGKLYKKDHFAGKARGGGLKLSESADTPESRTALQNGSASGDQVEDQDDQRDYQQNVNHAAGYVKAEAQEPQKQNDDKDCPKHIYLLFRIAGA